MPDPLIIIPARMGSTRLPGKPLADIGGAPMIVRVWERAQAAGSGPVIVAAGESEIVDAVRVAGGEAVLTRTDHPSGSDRVFEALETFDPGRRYDTVINLQGDLPLIDPAEIRAAAAACADTDIGTLVTEIRDPDEHANPNVVKAVLALTDPRRGRALYFTRAMAPAGDGPRYHHIGIYAYRRAALEKFVSLPPSPLERRERLEQLRALEAGMTIGVAVVDSVPFGVDTPADLERARSYFRD